jgi:serine/threonine protein kinase
MQDYFIFRDYLCIVFEILSKSLYDAVQETELGLPLETIRNYMRQILEALVICKQSNLIHCDLKPENILLKRKDKSGIVVADFGSGCLENEIVYTYI